MCHRSATGYGQLTTSGSTIGMCSGNVTSGFLTLTYNSTSFYNTSSSISTTTSGSVSYITWRTSTSYSVTTTIPAYSGKIFAEPLIVKFKSGELNTGISSTATPPAGATAPTPTASLPPTSTDSTKPSGLSTGAKAGVGVGVSLGFIALVALGLFFWMRKRNYNRATAGQDGTKAELSNQPMEAKELSGNTYGRNGNHPAELDVTTEDSTVSSRVYQWRNEGRN